MSFPYLAHTTLKYKSPHASDLSFAKDETIRVTGPSPDDEDWLIGETLDGDRTGGFPKDFITPIQGDAAKSDSAEKTEPDAPVSEDPPPVPASAPAPPSPKLEPATLPPATPTPAPAPAPVATLPTSSPAAPSPAAPASSGEAEVSPPKSMKERLAFFAAAQNKVAPPPPIKPKPATGGLTWSQRQKLRQEQEAKEKAEGGGEASAPAVAAPPASTAQSSESSSAAAQARETEQKEKAAGLSAADAASSIGQGGSLKERMAALRAGGAFGSGEGSDEKPAAPVQPAGKVWSRPAAPPQPEPESDEDVPSGVEKIKSPGEKGGNPIGTGDRADEVQAEEPQEQTEEEEEKARRAAIAARMAKLGARGPMGMALPPKPARKPTRETVASSPAEEKSEPKIAPETKQEVGATQTTADTPAPAVIPETSTSPPLSVPIAAVPRRTAPPRRRAPAASASTPSTTPAQDAAPNKDQSLERVDTAGEIEPPPQVMVADEEEPLPKSEEQLEQEREQEEAGKGPQGAQGAEAAGISVSTVEEEAENQEGATLIGALGGADSQQRGVGTVTDSRGGDILSEDRPQEVEEGIKEGGQEKDDIIEEAQGGHLLGSPTPQPTKVPIHPPAEETPAQEAAEEGETPPPPPRSHPAVGLPKDELELKHDHDKALEEEVDDVPQAPPRPHRLSSDRPLGPRPLPSPVKERGALPPPPTGTSIIPPRDDEEDEDEEVGQTDDNAQDEEDEEDAPPPPPRRQSTSVPPIPITAPVIHDQQTEDYKEEEEAPPPPPPQRKPSLPAPIQIGLPTPNAPPKSASTASPISPRITQSPPRIPSSPTSPRSTHQREAPEESVKTAEDDEKTRRSGIATRMAKLGGIKFGMPPPSFKKPTTSSAGPTSPSEGRDEMLTSPIDREAPQSPAEERSSTEMAAPETQIRGVEPSNPVNDDDESSEAQATRRRATLARLRAGGALGFGMFNHGSAHQDDTSQEDVRGIQAEVEDVQGEDQTPPPPPGRPPVQPERTLSQSIEEEEEAPMQPPLGGPTSLPSRPSLPPPPQEEDEDVVPPPPVRPPRSSIDMPASPIRSPSGRRPPVPGPDRRYSQGPTSPIGRSSLDQMRLTEEPAFMMMNQNDEQPPPPPPNKSSAQHQAPVLPPIQTQVPATPPQRTLSTASRASRVSVESPSRMVGQSPVYSTRQESYVSASPAQPQQHNQIPPPTGESPTASTNQQGRPGYDQLVAASRESGSRLARAARAMFDQGRKAYYGDGSPTGFVLIALDNAHLSRPQAGWGQVVYEQEGASVLRRYDEPRAGDIAAFHDARLKGRKGLQSYDQHVGSVEEPLLAIVVDFEQKNKHKLKVLQVERGVPEEVSYRFDDLKSGKVVIYRTGL